MLSFHDTFYFAPGQICLYGLESTVLDWPDFSWLSRFLNNLIIVLWSTVLSPFAQQIFQLRGAFNKFPDFFVQAFKIVVDSWKFSILLLYILWDDWPTFMTSASNQQLQQQLEYILLKPDCHSWWVSKMQSDNMLLQYSVCKAFTVMEVWHYERCAQSWPKRKTTGSLSNLLFDRNFKAYVGSTLSDLHNQEGGISLGSFFVLTLFSIKINCIIKYLNPGINSAQYVDNFHDMQQIQMHPHNRNPFSTECGQDQKWATNNGFRFFKSTNDGFRFFKSKTQCVHFCSFKKMHNDLAIKLEGTKILIFEEYKIFGVIFYRNLSFILHLKCLKSKCNSSNERWCTQNRGLTNKPDKNCMDHKVHSGVSLCCNGKSDGLRNRSKRVHTPVVLLHSLSGKYPWERYEPPYPPSYGLNSTITVLLGEWLWH